VLDISYPVEVGKEAIGVDTSFLTFSLLSVPIKKALCIPYIKNLTIHISVGRIICNFIGKI